ncbi:MAG: NAD(+) synthase [Lachnospiraceae bacterium]|nr:NAD(+) synthase [Lachnospiraceae bacterium]
MKDGIIRVAAVTPHVTVCDIDENVLAIKQGMKEACAGGAKIVVFPELSITGYTAGDLFGQDLLIKKSEEALFSLTKESALYDAVFFVGLPFAYRGKLYNSAAAISGGEILGLVPKTYLPNYREFYEARQFEAGFQDPVEAPLSDGTSVPFGTDILFSCNTMQDLLIGVEICEDLWVPNPPSTRHAMNGATLIVNLSASNEIVGKEAYRRSLVENQAARLYAGYIYACSGPTESTQDLVFAGHNLISDGGSLVAESKLFSEGATFGDIDIARLQEERRRMNTFAVSAENRYWQLPFHLELTETHFTREVPPLPFVPANKETLDGRLSEILDIQTMGLVKRLRHTHAPRAVIGISGGLDSTLALLVTVRAFDYLEMGREHILSVTMPGFGTTDRTYQNAVSMIKKLGTDFREIKIGPAVNRHFKDIGYDPEGRDTTYENCQARERTQILMDLANEVGGLVIGTGDLSELALGWATYNGDHMSMYGVNASVPKTLVKHLVRYYADHIAEDEKLTTVLYDILDTPISPELLPADENGDIAQKTEDLVGPYRLHDFFLFYMMRYGFPPRKILRLAEKAFDGEYNRETILKWEKNFYRRFFSQQFKRSCLPDGPKVGSVSLSPRGDWRMPSDAASALWLSELEDL